MCQVSNVNNSLKNSNFKGAAHAKLNNSGKYVEKTPRQLAGYQSKIPGKFREIYIFSGTDQRKVLLEQTEIKKSAKGFI